MLYRLCLLSCLCLVVIAGCTPALYVVSDAYRNQKLSAHTLVVAPFSVSIANMDDVTDDLGAGDGTSVFKRHFERQFKGFMTDWSRIDSVYFGQGCVAGTIETRTFQVADTVSFSLALPKDSTRVLIDSAEAEYVLFINNFSVRRHEEMNRYQDSFDGMKPQISKEAYSEALVYTLDYCLWDNIKGAIIAYGRVERKSMLSLFAMRTNNWDQCASQVACEIVKHSPFDVNETK